MLFIKTVTDEDSYLRDIICSSVAILETRLGHGQRQMTHKVYRDPYFDKICCVSMCIFIHMSRFPTLILINLKSYFF